MKINEIVALAKEYESLSKNVEYTDHFLRQVKDQGSTLSVLGGGAEMDVHHQYTHEFIQHIEGYTASVNTRLSEIEQQLEGNYAEGEA